MRNHPVPCPICTEPLPVGAADQHVCGEQERRDVGTWLAVLVVVAAGLGGLLWVWPVPHG